VNLRLAVGLDQLGARAFIEFAPTAKGPPRKGRRPCPQSP
jgi:hypothetical protein